MSKESNQGYYIFVAYVTRPDGTRDYAKNHGKRAWRIWITKRKKAS